MNPLADLVENRTECRTPIVLFTEDLSGVGTLRDPQALVAGIAEAAGGVPLHYLELYHADDRTAGAAIDSCIKAGEWLLLHAVEESMSGLDVLLRYIGRRLFTIMPNRAKRSRLEDFRLFLCIPRGTVQSAVFRKLAFRMSYEMILPALEELAREELNSPLDTGSKAGTTSYRAAPITRPSSVSGGRESISITSVDHGSDSDQHVSGGGLLRRMLSFQKQDKCGLRTVDVEARDADTIAVSNGKALPERAATDCPVGAIFFRSGIRSKTPLDVRRAASARQRRPVTAQARRSCVEDQAVPIVEPVQSGAALETFESKASDVAQSMYLALLRRFHKEGIDSANDAMSQAESLINSLNSE